MARVYSLASRPSPLSELSSLARERALHSFNLSTPLKVDG